MVPQDSSLFEWAVGGLATVTGFFLKHLHGKVDKAASKEDLSAAIASVKAEHSSERQELRTNQIAIFKELELNGRMLTEVATKVNLLVSGHIDHNHSERRQ